MRRKALIAGSCIAGISALAVGLGLLFIAVFSAEALPQQQISLDTLILNMSKVAQEVSYSGRFVHRMRHAGRDIDLVMRIYRWAPDRLVLSFEAPDTLKNTSVVMNGDVVRFVGDPHVGRAFRFSGTRSLLQGSRLFREIALLKQNYIMTVQQDNWIGRPVYRLTIEPKYRHRPSLNLWVDQETFLILRFERRSPLLETAEVYQFQNIHFEPPDTTIFSTLWARAGDSRSGEGGGRMAARGGRKSETFASLVALLAHHDGPVLVPERLPEGFMLQTIRRFERRDRHFIHMLYGDGLTFISLFQHHERWFSRHRNRSRVANRPYSVVRGKRDGIRYDLVSELPETELQVMAGSLVTIQRATPVWQRPAWLALGGAVALVALMVAWHRFGRKS